MEKKKKWIIALILIILLLLLVILYLLFCFNKSFTITFDTDGGSEIASIEVKDGEIVKLPETPTKDGYKFVGWTNDKGRVVTTGTKVTKNLKLKAEWVKSDAKTVSIQFDTDGGNEINNVVIEQGKVVLLPVEPVKDGYIFVGWIDANGNLITDNMEITANIILKAFWIKKDAETKKINFDTDGGNAIGSIIIEKGKVILLPINPIKIGYVFAGWVDENGNSVTKDTIISENMTIKALWKSYTCPTGCTPIGDGSKCTREKTASMQTTYACPSGSTLYNTWYGSGSFCIKLSTKVDASLRQCDTWEHAEVDYKDSKGKSWCVKTVSKVATKKCPSGYTKSGNVCKKTETINCTAN